MAIASYNSKKQSLAPDVEPLIKHMTGFKEDDKNFSEVAKFMYSNLIHHNFPTVNPTAVKKSIQGNVEKLKIHGMNNRAKRLQELVNIYDEMINSTTHTQMDLQWNVLLLLLKLSSKPTSLTDEELEARNVKLEPKRQEEDINWAEYLKEGLEDVQSYAYNSESDDLEPWSSSSDEGEGEGDGDKGEGEWGEGEEHDLSPPGYGGIPHPSLWHVASPSPSPAAPSVRSVLRAAVQSEHWLRNNVQHGWWLDSSCPPPPEQLLQSRHPTARMCRLWEENEAEKCRSLDESLPAAAQLTTEYKVLKEIVWMLAEPADAVFFKQDADGRFYVKSHISLASTVPASLHLALCELCPYIDMVKTLRGFEEELYRREGGSNCTLPPPNTLKAYCTALSHQMKPFTDAVLRVEARLNSQEETMTLVSVKHDLSPHLERLRCLSEIHDQATAGWRSQPPWLVATRLLSVLYECLLEASDESHVKLCLDLFLASFAVYLHIIDVWLSDGRLDDWRAEFIVLRDAEADCLRVMPYEVCMRESGVRPVSLLARLVAVAGDAQDTVTVVARLNKLAELRTLAHKGCLVKEFTENIYNEIKRLNGYTTEESAVEEVVTQVPSANTFLTAKSNETTSDSSIARSKDSSRSQISSHGEIRPEKPTSCRAVQADSDRLGSGEGGEEVPAYLKAVSSQALYNQVMEAACRDSPLIGQALRSFLPPQQTPPPSQSSSQSVSSSLLCSEEHNHSVGLMSIYRVLERQLELVVSRHRVASSLVTRTLRADHHLMRHFTLLRDVFFMESGIFAQRFYSYLFNEISSGRWGAANALSLTVQLQTCVEEIHPALGHLFTVTVARSRHDGPARPTDNPVRRALACISLGYTPDWPISSVITQDTIHSYNLVFRFLLHMKYAFWTLRNISLSDLSGSPNTVRVRHLHMLKLWMYHSANTLHAYFMGLVLRRFSTLMDDSVRQADSVDAIVKAHKKFLKEVKMHCLQDEPEGGPCDHSEGDEQQQKPRSKNILEVIIMKLVWLCGELSRQWRLEADGQLTDTDLVQLRDRYLLAYRGLLHCLQALDVEPEATNYLDELRSEIVHSVPTAWTEI